MMRQTLGRERLRERRFFPMTKKVAFLGLQFVNHERSYFWNLTGQSRESEGCSLPHLAKDCVRRFFLSADVFFRSEQK